MMSAKDHDGEADLSSSTPSPGCGAADPARAEAAVKRVPPAAPGPGAKPLVPKPPEPSPEEIAAMRAKIVAVLEEKRLGGEEITLDVQHKEIQFTGRVIRIEPESGFVVLESVDGRRRGLYFILGGHLRTKDGREIRLPVDGVPR